MTLKVYLAGGFYWNEDNWRYDLVKGLNSEPPMVPCRGSFKKWGALQNALFDCFDFVGPFPDERDEYLPSLIKEAINDADIVFAWADDLIAAEIAKISAEITYAGAKGKLVGVGSTDEGNGSWNSIWIAHDVGSFFPFGYIKPTPKDSLKECIKSLLEFWPLENRMALWKLHRARSFFDRKFDKAGYVYIIRAETGHYKIGRTNNVPTRMNLFAVKLPFKFEIINYFPCDDMYEAESHLHKVYAEKRVNGEWFSLSNEDAELLGSIGQIDRREIVDKTGYTINLDFDGKYMPWWANFTQ